MICRLKVFQDQGGCDGAKTLERTREHVEGGLSCGEMMVTQTKGWQQGNQDRRSVQESE